METENLKCGPDLSENGIARLQPQGPISLQTISQSPLLSAAQRAASGPTGVVLFDFANAQVIDGFGLAHLLSLTLQLKQKALVVAACNLGNKSLALFHELGLDRFLQLYSDLTTARQKLKPNGPQPAQNISAAEEISPAHELLPVTMWPAAMGPTQLATDPDTSEPAPPRPLNLIDRRPQGPGAGFGSLWLKTYKVRLVSQEVTLDAVAERLKKRLPEYWPEGNRITLPEGLTCGAPGIIDLTLPGGLKLSTGIRVLNVSDLAFAFVPIQGHMEAGWISFGVTREDGYPTVVVQSLARTGDPFYELGFDIFGHRQQEEFWNQTLSALALDFGEKALIEISASCLDSPKNWRGWSTIYWNAGLRTITSRALSRLQRLWPRQSDKPQNEL
ncbi:MAG: hypothetical protein JXR80_04850 [Deltaproteobacteria bacterium]|nr:hypothetical protein [Deltaproteobacteria bacterium]